MSAAESLVYLKRTWKDYKAATAGKLRKKFLQGITDCLALERNVTSDMMIQIIHRIDDMRLIQLMHPEFQINNKLAGKQVLANVEICYEVVDEYHGSKKHHQAGLLVLNNSFIGRPSTSLEGQAAMV